MLLSVATSRDSRLDDGIVEFLKCICSHVAPLSSVAPYSILPVLDTLSNGRDIDIQMQETLFNIAPIFYDFYKWMLKSGQLLSVRLG